MDITQLCFLLFFICAIIHSFLAPSLASLAEKWGAHSPKEICYTSKSSINTSKKIHFFPQTLLFFSEVEVIFGLWCIPALILFYNSYGSLAFFKFLNKDDHHEPVFIMISMVMATTAPILRFAEKALYKFASLGNHTPLAWWFTVQLIGPLIGAFFKETIAMTISASLLGVHFFAYKPSRKLAYMSLALLLTNISVGGVITNFAATPMTLLKKAWYWDLEFMLTHFALRSILAIGLSTFAVYLICKSDFQKMVQEKISSKEPPYIPFWITFVHIAFLAWIIWISDYGLIAFGSFVLFLGFYQATASYQSEMSLRQPIMVGFFIASIFILGGLQGFWIEPIVEKLNDSLLIFFGLGLTAINQNASVVYIATQIPAISLEKQILFISSIVAGGGLTYLSNTPNLIAYELLQKHFDHPISVARQMQAALLPVLISILSFVLFR